MDNRFHTIKLSMRVVVLVHLKSNNKFNFRVNKKNATKVQTVFSLQIVYICKEVQDLSKVYMDNRFHTIKLSMRVVVLVHLKSDNKFNLRVNKKERYESE